MIYDSSISVKSLACWEFRARGLIRKVAEEFLAIRKDSSVEGALVRFDYCANSRAEGISRVRLSVPSPIHWRMKYVSATSLILALLRFRYVTVTRSISSLDLLLGNFAAGGVSVKMARRRRNPFDD
jgi:hypothetical protein